ncbi:MAG: type II toxin-antitoxin system RelE/ParE family toxin [Methanospirillum sp.]
MNRPYAVELTTAAVRDLRELDSAGRRRIGAALDDLARQEDPYRHVKHLHGSPGSAFHALRVGDYRVILTIEDAVMVIFVIEIEHRSTAYRRF